MCLSVCTGTHCSFLLFVMYCILGLVLHFCCFHSCSFGNLCSGTPKMNREFCVTNS